MSVTHATFVARLAAIIPHCRYCGEPGRLVGESERDDIMGERELLRCRVAETETEVTRARNAQLPTLRDQLAMAYMQAGKTPAQAYTLADEALKERSK